MVSKKDTIYNKKGWLQMSTLHTLGIDIGSTTVKIAILDKEDHLLFSDYERHFANIKEIGLKMGESIVKYFGKPMKQVKTEELREYIMKYLKILIGYIKREKILIFTLVVSM